MLKNGEPLTAIKQRVPPRRDVGRVFAASALTVQAWAFFNLFREVPAMRLRMDTWDLIGIIAYVQAFALLEAVIVLLAVVTIGFMLPGRWLRDRFGAAGSLMVLVSAGWAIAVHFRGTPLAQWTAGEAASWSVLYLLSLVLALILVWRLELLQRVLNRLFGEAVLLALLYSVVGLLAIVIVVVRNV